MQYWIPTPQGFVCCLHIGVLPKKNSKLPTSQGFVQNKCVLFFVFFFFDASWNEAITITLLLVPIDRAKILTQNAYNCWNCWLQSSGHRVWGTNKTSAPQVWRKDKMKRKVTGGKSNKTEEMGWMNKLLYNLRRYDLFPQPQAADW